MRRKTGSRTKGLTMHRVEFVRVQKVQNIEETLNEFKRTHLVRRKVGGCTEWEGMPVAGQVNCDCAPCCISMHPEAAEC